MVEFRIRDGRIDPTEQRQIAFEALTLFERSGTDEQVTLDFVFSGNNQVTCRILVLVAASLTTVSLATGGTAKLAFREALVAAEEACKNLGWNGHPDPPPIFAIAWDPALMSDDEYAELVDIMGDFVRANGGAGVRRVAESEVGYVGAGVPVS